MKLVKQGISNDELTSVDFRVSDARYGVTMNIYECPQCSFRQCESVNQLVEYYNQLEDPDYEKGRNNRKKQMEKIVRWLRKYWCGDKNGVELLDVGAGSGMFVEVANERGFQAIGVEPSRYLSGIAQEMKLPVHYGTAEDLQEKKTFDVITMIDVIEHVDDPIALLQTCHGLLREGGVLLVITPDCTSIAAKLFKWKWWHYRIAHISYFSVRTLNMALTKNGFTPMKTSFATWYFALDYLFERLENYLPKAIIPKWKWLNRVTIPINLFDSICLLAKKDN